MMLPALPSYEKQQSGSPRAAAGFRFHPGGFRRLTTVALSSAQADSAAQPARTIEQELNDTRYRVADTPGPGAYDCVGRSGAALLAGPLWSMGRRTWTERKIRGAKQSLEKSWFHNEDPWKQKVDTVFRDDKWPEPASYRVPAIGQADATRPRGRDFTFTSRSSFDPASRRSRELPAPGAYDVDASGSFDAQSPRRSGGRIFERRSTQLWPPLQPTPGPGRYLDDKATALATRAGGRRFTMRGPKNRIDYSRHAFGPYACF